MKTMKSVGVLLVGLSLMGFLFPEAKAQTFLTNGLVGFWAMHGSAADTSGSGNDGVVYGATLGTNRFGIASDSYAFSATGTYPGWTGAYIETSAANGFPVGTNDFSLSLWVLISSTSPDYQMLVCNKALNQFQLCLTPFNGSASTVEFYIGQNLPPASSSSAPLEWTLNRWYNLQVTRAANVLTIYRDGLVIAQNPWTQGNEAAPAEQVLDFGYRVNPGNQAGGPLLGGLDDIRLYNRAFSSDEVRQLYEFEAAPIMSVRKAVYVSSGNLKVGTNYVLQVSSDLNGWTNSGSSFTATNAVWRSPAYFDVDDFNQLFFRLQVSP